MELTQHPLSAAFPAMGADDFAALVQDIKAKGQREPIMLLEGMVLDGWHRYRACLELGLKPQQFNFGDGDPVAFVLSHNLHRRHLTPSQRAAAVVACSAWAPRGRPGKPETVSGLSRDKDMAKAAGTSDRTIRDAKAAHKAGLTDAVKQGAMTAHQAANVARGKPPAAPKPALAAPAAPPAATAAKQEELSDAREAIAILAEENERLNDRLAVESMDASEEEKLKAAAVIAELRAELKTANAELKAVRAVRDDYMRENGQLKKTVASLQRKLKKVVEPA